MMSRAPLLQESNMCPSSHASIVDDGHPVVREVSDGPEDATPHVLIVSERSLYAGAIQALLDSRDSGCSSQVLTPLDPPRLTRAGPEVVLFFPQDWREVAARLPGLRRQTDTLPWVFLAEGRLVGMF